MAETPKTPDWMAPLSRELNSVIAKKNILTCRTRKRILDDLEETARQSEDEEMARLRKKAVDEVVSSEKSYLRHLEIVEEFFMRPIEEAALIPHEDFTKIFGDVSSILQVNRELLKGLEGSQDRIGKVFAELAPYLKFYSTYTNDFSDAVKLVDKYMSKNKNFRVLVSNQESRPEVQLKLNSLLITPVQRIPRYKLLLEDVIKRTPENHPDRESLKEALEQIDAVAWHINEHLRDHEDAIRMLDIQRSLVGGQPKILAPGRKLLRQGVLMKVPRTGSSSGQPRYFFLFSDIVMYCKIRGSSGIPFPKHNALDCGCVLPLKRVVVETVIGRGVFKLTCGREELLLYSNDGSSTSEEWVSAIGEAVNRHKTNSSSLRKESSRRTPLKRPDLIKLRRESLSQIMMLRVTKEKAKKLLLTPKSSEKQWSVLREANNDDVGQSPKFRLRKRKAHPTPDPGTAKKTRGESMAAMTPTSEAREAPEMTPQSAIQLRAKARKGLGSRSKTRSLRTLSMFRRDKLKDKSKVSLFRSPSIYEQPDGGEEDEDVVMSSYLNGKIVPLTPSQQPTNVSHLAQPLPEARREAPQREDDGSTLSTSFSARTEENRPQPESETSGYCSIM